MNTKYNVGQKLFLVDNNKVATLAVLEISIYNNGIISYRLTKDGQYNKHAVDRKEHEVFSTKEELIKSL